MGGALDHVEGLATAARFSIGGGGGGGGADGGPAWEYEDDDDDDEETEEDDEEDDLDADGDDDEEYDAEGRSHKRARVAGPGGRLQFSMMPRPGGVGGAGRIQMALPVSMRGSRTCVTRRRPVRSKALFDGKPGGLQVRLGGALLEDRENGGGMWTVLALACRALVARNLYVGCPVGPSLYPSRCYAVFHPGKSGQPRSVRAVTNVDVACCPLPLNIVKQQPNPKPQTPHRTATACTTPSRGSGC